MDFDHIRGKKKFTIALNFKGGKMGLARIIEEAKKCELVCANCHRIRTQKKLGRPIW